MKICGILNVNKTNTDSRLNQTAWDWGVGHIDGYEAT